MKISGFTFIRNAVKFDYPVVESILSILPLCDEFIVAVGKSDDGTRDLISSIGSPKIRIIDTVWDETLREGGQVLAVETDKAFDAVSPGSTWAFYIQADEVVHEKSHDLLRQAMERWKDEPAVEGLLLSYVHFYGSYDFYGDSRKWYRNEVRIIRNDKQIRSYKDAQGFRNNGKPLQAHRSAPRRSGSSIRFGMKRFVKAGRFLPLKPTRRSTPFHPVPRGHSISRPTRWSMKSRTI